MGKEVVVSKKGISAGVITFGGIDRRLSSSPMVFAKNTARKVLRLRILQSKDTARRGLHLRTLQSKDAAKDFDQKSKNTSIFDLKWLFHSYFYQ